jgi:hypothetical protein
MSRVDDNPKKQLQPPFMFRNIHTVTDLTNFTMSWFDVCFEGMIVFQAHPLIRAMRFYEEASELVQSRGLSREDAHRVVDYVYDRPVGDSQDEIGGSLITLLLLAKTGSYDIFNCFRDELHKNYGRIPKIRARQLEKPQPTGGVGIDLPALMKSIGNG